MSLQQKNVSNLGQCVIRLAVFDCFPFEVALILTTLLISLDVQTIPAVGIFTVGARCSEMSITTQPISVPLDTEQSQPPEWQKQHLLVGKGEADTQRSPPFSSPRHKKSGSLRLNGTPKQQKAPELLVEDIRDKDGERLTSLKLAFDDKPKPSRTQTELVSGRRAGASWDRSQYVDATGHPL